MEEGDFNFFWDCIFPLLKNNNFIDNTFKTESQKWFQYVHPECSKFQVYNHYWFSSLFYDSDKYICKYPILKHRWFTKKPYLSFKKYVFNYKTFDRAKFEKIIRNSCKTLEIYKLANNET